jgi:cytochrome P450
VNTANYYDDLAPFDPNDEATLTDPYPVYARYRRHAPVHWGAPYSPGAKGCWYLFRHQDVVDLLRDRRFRRRWPEGGPRHRNVPDEQRPFWDVFDRLLLSTDPPDHRRLRTLVSHAFTPQKAESYRPLAESVATELVSALPDDFDLVEDYAAQLSFTIICTILGVPIEDGPMVRKWITQFGDGIDLRKGEHAMREASAAASGLAEYFGALVTRRRTDPADDLVTALINARHESNRLSHDELLAMCVQLVFAGHETTTTQITTTMFHLLRNPEQLELVRDDLALIPSAVNESLRLEGSVQTAAARKPVEDVVIGDVTIPAGEPVIAFIGAANRDPAVFANPDLFDVRRDNANAVAFGAGIHYCLGAQLAKVETEAGVAALLRHRPVLQVNTETPPKYGKNIVLPGLRLLRVTDRS